jgi:hypothetical protein
MNQDMLVNQWKIGGGLDGMYQPKSEKVKWISTDCYENFIKNQPTNYTEDSITYDFNSHGFRTREFELNSRKKNVLFLGCSHTMGVGLRDTEVWTHHVSQIFNEMEYNCYNLGIGGASGDTVARLLTNSINYVHPIIVFIFWPALARFERYYQNQTAASLTTELLADQTRDVVEIYCDAHCYNLYQKNQLIVDLLADLHKFTAVSLASDKFLKNVLEKEYPDASTIRLARDNMHWSPAIHQDIADLMIQQYKEMVNNAG